MPIFSGENNRGIIQDDGFFFLDSVLDNMFKFLCIMTVIVMFFLTAPQYVDEIQDALFGTFNCNKHIGFAQVNCNRLCIAIGVGICDSRFGG